MDIKELREKIQTESSLTIFIKKYFRITDAEIYEIILAYIDYLMKLDPKFFETLKMYIKEDSSELLIDKLLSTQLLPDSWLNKNYFSRLKLEKNKIKHKGYLMLRDSYLDYNNIKKLFDSLDEIDKLQETFLQFIIKQFINEYLYDKIETYRKEVEKYFLEMNDLNNVSPEIQKDILNKEKEKIDKMLENKILNEYQFDIKEKYLDKIGFNKVENKIAEKDKILLNFKDFFRKNIFFDFNEFQNIKENIELLSLSNYFFILFYLSFYISYILSKKDIIAKEIKQQLKETKDVKQKKKLNKLLKDLDELKKINKDIKNILTTFIDFLNENEFIIYKYNLNLVNFKGIDFNIQQEIKSNYFKLNSIEAQIDYHLIKNFIWELKDDKYKKEIKDYLINMKYNTTDFLKIKQINIFLNNYLSSFSEEKKEDKAVIKKYKQFINYIKNAFELLDNVFNTIDIFSLETEIKHFYEKDDIYPYFKYINIYLKEIKDLFNVYDSELSYSIYKNILINLIRFNANKELNLFLLSDNEVIKTLSDLLAKKYNINIEDIKDEDSYKKYIQPVLKQKKKELIKDLGSLEILELLILYHNYDDVIKLYKQSQQDKKLKIDKFNKKYINLFKRKLEDKYSDYILVIKTFFLNVNHYKKYLDYFYTLLINVFLIDKFINIFLYENQDVNNITIFFNNIIKLYLYVLEENIFLFDFLKTYIPYVKNISFVMPFINIKNFLFKFFEFNLEYINSKNLDTDIEEYKKVVKNLKIELQKKYNNDLYNKIFDYIIQTINSQNISSDELGKTKGFKQILNYLVLNLQEQKEEYQEINDLLNFFLSTLNIDNKTIYEKNLFLINYLSKLNNVLKLDIYKLFYLLLKSDINILRTNDFFVIPIEDKAFIITDKFNFKTLNNIVLTLENDYKDKEHIFTFINSDTFYFFNNNLTTKLYLPGISVFTRDLLSWCYYNNEMSDLDIFGVKQENFCRFKVRLNGVYKLMKRYEGSTIKEVFSYSDLETFLNDIVSLGGRIGNDLVEDTSIEVGGVKFRIGIMKDGNNISISIRKNQSTNHHFSNLKGKELLRKLKEYFNWDITVKKLEYQKDTITLEKSYSKKDVEILKDASTMDRGVFLIIGKTRSGKSTSLRNFLDYIFDESLKKGEVKKIITLEDPIEMRNVNFNQIEVPSEAGMLEMAVNKGLKRQDPDIVVVGEIRGPSVLPGVLTVANNSSTFSTMHITNPIDGLFTLKDFAKVNGNTLMDVVNVLNVIISQKLVNKINKEKVEKVIQKYGVDYDSLYQEGIVIFKNKSEIETYLRSVGVNLLVPVLNMEFDLIMDKYKKDELSETDKEFVQGYLFYVNKTYELYNKQGYLIKEIHSKYTKPKLYYDYITRSFIDANMELMLRLDDKNSPIKEIKMKFVEAFELKEEKALIDYFAGELPYYGGLNILDIGYYIYILKKLYKYNIRK